MSISLTALLCKSGAVGWSIEYSGNYWHYLKDNLGRTRASYFCKTACYDYDVFGYCNRRFSTAAFPLHGLWEDGDAIHAATVTDGGRPIWSEKTRSNATKREYGYVIAIADAKLKELNLNKATIEEEWDMPDMEFVSNAKQAAAYRTKRIKHYKKLVTETEEELKTLRAKFVPVYSDLDCMSFGGFGNREMAIYVVDKRRGQRKQVLREQSEKDHANHQYNIERASDKLSSLKCILYTMEHKKV